METNYLMRALLWIKELLTTLLQFWIKNLHETPVILKFIFEKLVNSPRFFSRNVLIEKHSQEFEKDLRHTINLYKKYNRSFNPKNPNSYKKFDSILSDKMQILYFLVRKLRPKIVVETGVAAGKSTGYVLQAITNNRFGELYSIDLPFQWYIYGNHKLHLDSLPAGKTPGYLIPKSLKSNWKLILGNTYSELPKLLKKLRKISLFIHDSEHTDKTMLFEFNQSWPYIQQGGLLLSDDISYTKAFDHFSKEKRLKKIIFKDLGIIQKNG